MLQKIRLFRLNLLMFSYGGKTKKKKNEKKKTQINRNPSRHKTHAGGTYLSLFAGQAPVQPDVGEPSVVQEDLQDVQHLRHLSEDEDAALFGPQLLQQDG